MATVSLRIQRVEGAADLPLPSYATGGSAGMDLRARLDSPLLLAPGQRHCIPTGLVIAIPPGFEGQVRPRSGLALKYGIGMVNAPGTIDSDYRGEVGVILINWGEEPVEFQRGDRIAQLVIAPVVQVRIEEQESLDVTARGTGGFGSTGAI